MNLHDAYQTHELMQNSDPLGILRVKLSLQLVALRYNLHLFSVMNVPVRPGSRNVHHIIDLRPFCSGRDFCELICSVF